MAQSRGGHQLERGHLNIPFVKGSNRKGSPTAPTDSPVPAMEAFQEGARVEAEEPPIGYENRANNSHPGGTTGTNQIIWKEALSDGGGHDPKENWACQGEGKVYCIRRDCSV